MSNDVVVDASYLASVFDHDEEVREHAEQVQRELSKSQRMISPRLILYELGSVVRKAHLRVAPGDREAAHHTLLETVRMEATRLESVRRIHSIADEYGLSFYDAAYLQLAIEQDATLITDDRFLRTAAERELGAERSLDGATAFRVFVTGDSG